MYLYNSIILWSMLENLYKISEDERRMACKQKLESLEFWLRRLIQDNLSKKYGPNYLNAKKSIGDHIINNRIRKSIKSRKEAEPERYQRLIDASLLEHQIDIICNNELYQEFFFEPFKKVYPNGRVEAKTSLEKLKLPRNCLYHANPISIRMSEQVICYSNDIIDSLKEFYQMTNKEKEYNIPTIIKFSDHFGNTYHKGNTDSSHIPVLDFTNKKEYVLYPGDQIKIELEVDPSYEGKCHFRFGGLRDWSEDNCLLYTLKLSDVKYALVIHCQVKSDKPYHVQGGFCDDQISVRYKILPPIDDSI